MTAGDAFAWWEDKQVAVEVNGDLVRGWVLACRHLPEPTAGRVAGQMSIVLFISDPAVAAGYPVTVVVGVLDDGGHGRPRTLRGLWAEEDLTDVHSTRSPTAAPPIRTE